MFFRSITWEVRLRCKVLFTCNQQSGSRETPVHTYIVCHSNQPLNFKSWRNTANQRTTLKRQIVTLNHSHTFQTPSSRHCGLLGCLTHEQSLQITSGHSLLCENERQVIGRMTQYMPPVNTKLVNWLLMGVLGDAHMYLKSESNESVRWMAGSDWLRFILGMDMYNDSREASNWGQATKALDQFCQSQVELN